MSLHKKKERRNMFLSTVGIKGTDPALPIYVYGCNNPT